MEENKTIEHTQELAGGIFVKYLAYVRYLAALNAPEPTLVDDIVNDVCLAFLTNADRWDMTRDLRPILRKITKDTANKHWIRFLKSMPAHLRKIAERVHKKTMEEEAEVQESELDDKVTALNLCLKKLTDRSRRLIMLHYFNGVPLKQIAAEMEQNANTVYSTVDRIRIVLKTCVENTLKLGVSDV